MKRNRTKNTAAALAAGLCLTSCGFSPEINEPVDVYGPPPAETSPEPDDPFIDEEENEDPVNTEEPAEDEEDQDSDPEGNIAEPLYGPPPVSG